MENLSLYVYSKYDLKQIVIFKDNESNPLDPKIKIGIIIDIEARLNKVNNQVYIVYTISEISRLIAHCTEDSIIMTIEAEDIKELSNTYKERLEAHRGSHVNGTKIFGEKYAYR